MRRGTPTSEERLAGVPVAMPQSDDNGNVLTYNDAEHQLQWAPAAGGGQGGSPPTGTGFRHVTGGVEDGAAKLVDGADVGAAAGIAESKLALNFPTHSPANDPAAGEKAALAGTSGTPGSGNRYLTDADPRNANARTPTAHGAALHDATVEATASKGQPSGYAALDAAGKVPPAQLGGAGADGTKFLRGDQSWAIPAGGAGGNPAVTTTEVNLGILPRHSGRFTIATTGQTPGKPVMIQQATGPYTGKGTRADEAEMDQVLVTGRVLNATTLECFWQTVRSPVRGAVRFDWWVSS